MYSAGFLLMSGGHSSRMGRCKALIEINGRTLLDTIAAAGRDFEERILSVNDPSIPSPEGFVRVADLYKDCGPLGGLHAALSAAKSDVLLCAPCDAPYYTGELAAYLLSRFTDDLDALIPVDADGRAHPLMGAYAKGALPVITKNLEAGRLKLMRTLDEMRTQFIPLPAFIDPRVFQNLNTQEDVAAL